MSFADDLLTILTSYAGGYRLLRQKLAGYENFSHRRINYQKIKEQTLRTTLSRLKKCGLVKNKNRIWAITKKGEKYLKNKSALETPHFGHLKNKNKQKEMVIIFDVPEKKRRQRDWLRAELIALNFIPLQKSVWFGPAPPPKEFIKYLNEINLLQYLKFFKASREDIIG